MASSLPCKTKTSDECVLNFQKFVGPQCKPEHVYSDNSKELIKALKELSGHMTPPPHTAQNQMVLLSALLERLRNVRRALLLNLVSMSRGGQRLSFATASIRMSLTSWMARKQHISVALELTSQAV